jgi:hypothetical protein
MIVAPAACAVFKMHPSAVLAIFSPKIYASPVFDTEINYW